MITKVRFHRFKQFRDHEFGVAQQPITLVAGANNAGKSSLLHGLAVWEFCRTVIEAERGPDAFVASRSNVKRQGIGLGAEEFSPINIPSLNHLWTNLRTSKQDEPDGYTLRVGCTWEKGDAQKDLEFGLALSNDRLFVRTTSTNLALGDSIPRLAYLPPFAGITAREMRLTGAIRRRRIGEGLAGAVLRNLLLDMYKRNTLTRQELRGDRRKLLDRDLRRLRESDPWELLQGALRETFSAELDISDFSEEYHSRPTSKPGRPDDDRLTWILVDPVNPRLSGYQARFLLWLLERYQEIEAGGDKRGMWAGAVRVPRAGAGQSRSDSASISRALRRLEDRGLIERLNHVSGSSDEGYVTQMRTTHIRLTESGRALAERLTQTTWWGS